MVKMVGRNFAFTYLMRIENITGLYLESNNVLHISKGGFLYNIN